MKKKIDWLNHFLEFIVVIIGILMAFQLNQCSTERTQDKTIATHLSAIVEETNFNKYNVGAAIKLAESNLNKIDSLFYLIGSNGNLRAINSISLELLNIGGLYVKKNAYSSLVESGDVRYMRNFDEKKRMVNLYEYYKWVEALDKTSFEDYGNGFYPYLKDNLDLVNGQLQDREVYSSRKYLNILATYRHLLNNRLNKYKECLVEVNNYLKKKD